MQDPPSKSWLWRALLDGTEAGVALLDTDLRYVYVNPALARINGVAADAHIGRTISEMVPGVDAGEEVLWQVLADGRPRELVSSGQTRADSPHRRRYWQGVYHRIEDDHGHVQGLGAIILEVSADRETQRELERARERLLLLDAAAVRIGSTLEIGRTCQELCDLLVEVLADVATVQLLATGVGDGRRPAPEGTLRLHRAAVAARRPLREQVDRIAVPGEHVEEQGGSAVARCLETGRPVVAEFSVATPPASPHIRPPHPAAAHEPPRPAPRQPPRPATRQPPHPEPPAADRTIGMHPGIVVPLAARGGQLGAVVLVRAGSSRPFDDDDLAVARTLADRAAISLDNARRYSREHGIAVELQRALLSAPGDAHPRLDVASRYLPAGATDLVGGDWFDTLTLPGGLTLLAMGDVMGHGVEAAVDMSQYRSMLRAVAGEGDAPDGILRRMDTLLAAAGAQRPATCLLGLVDPDRGAAWFASAGHLPPAVVAPDGRVRLPEVPPGPPLGADLHGEYRTTYVPWPAGHTLLLYTDGLVERRTEDIDESLARLAALRLPHAGGALDALLARIVQRLVPSAAEDDVALLAARARR